MAAMPTHEPPPARRRRRRKLRTVQLLPSLMTAGNLVAGVLACAYMVDAGAASAAQTEALFERAAWLLFIGMFLDGLDGRVARMTGTTSAFGAQLDSMADVVSFGVAPALLAKTLLGVAFVELPTKLVFSFSLVYVLGAAFRLARYNVESERLSREDRPHVTKTFRGLPSPAAAGVLASLVLLRREFHGLEIAESIDWAILISAPLLGLFMVSRMPFSHVLNRYLGRRRVHPVTVVIVILLIYLIISHFVETVAGLFVLYALSGPFFTLLHRAFGVPRWVEHEEEDEEEDEELDLDELEYDEPPSRGRKTTRRRERSGRDPRACLRGVGQQRR